MVCPGMNHVLGTSYSASRSTNRLAPTSPNSPRAIRLGDRVRRGPIHTEMASKSNVKHTDTSLLAIAASSQSHERRRRADPRWFIHSPRAVAVAGSAPNDGCALARPAGGVVRRRVVL